MSKFNKIIKNLSTPRKWFDVYNTEKEIPELIIYDMIGSSMWEEGISPKAFIKEIANLEKKHKEVNIRINSPGGIVHDGFVIYNALKQSSLKKNVYIDGMAASCASFIAMAGDRIFMPETAEIMIHNAWGIAMGNAKDFMKESEHLSSLDKIIANIYASNNKLSKTEGEMLEWMDKETWMNGKEAIEFGFADELLTCRAVACAFDLDLDLLPNLPENFIKYQNSLQKRIKENELRDAGHSRNEAKELISKQRDAGKKDSEKLTNEAHKFFINKLKEFKNV